MSSQELYTVDVDDIWDKYLSAFPIGTDPIHRVNTWHNCNCCKNFIRNIGRLRTIDGDTVWDDVNLPMPYNIVATALRDLVRQAPITGVYRTDQASYGSGPNRDKEDPTIKYDHFFGRVVKHRVSQPSKERGDLNNLFGVFKRGLDQFTPAVLQQALEMIDENRLYRGAEFRAQVSGFLDLARQYDGSDTFVWKHLKTRVAGLRNVSIGTFLIELAEWNDPNNKSMKRDPDEAAEAFGRMLDPNNYKKPKSLVSQKQIDAALAKIEEMGMDVTRRMATIDDIPMEHLLFVANNDRINSPLELLMAGVAFNKKKPSKDGETIDADSFLKTILPGAKKVELLIEHPGNFMTLTTGSSIFKWDNPFSWSYDGDVTDSVKERVKQAGGKVDAPLRISLSWFNTDDLDLHVWDSKGIKIHFAAKKPIGSYGQLDVDMNVSGDRRDAVENVYFSKLLDGEYRVGVHNFTHREVKDVGFEVEVECGDTLLKFNCPREVRHNEVVATASFRVTNGQIVQYGAGDNSVQVGGRKVDKWGVQLGQYRELDAITLSPNYWGEGTGNLHVFFFVKEMENPESVRGIHNEYLKAELNEHRKVFEVLGSRSRAPHQKEQLSGVGFSSTKPEQVKVKVDGRPYVIQF
jgi:hypothetical protein